MSERRARLAEAKRGALIGRGRTFLLQAALIEISLGQRPELGSEGEYPIVFHNQAVSGLARHGYPWAPLLTLVSASGVEPHPTDPFFLSLQNHHPDHLRAQLTGLGNTVATLVTELAGLAPADSPSVSEPIVESAWFDPH